MKIENNIITQLISKNRNNFNHKILILILEVQNIEIDTLNTKMLNVYLNFYFKKIFYLKKFWKNIILERFLTFP